MIVKRVTAFLLPRRRTLDCGVVLNHRGGERVLETIAVVAMIAILVIFAIESYRPFVEKTRMVEAASLINSFRPDVVEHFAINGELPDRIARDREWFGSSGKYFERIDWEQHEIVFDLNDTIAERFAADGGANETSAQVPQLSFRVASSANGTRQIFLCGNAQAPAGFTASEPLHTSVREDLLPFFCRS